MNNGAAPTSNGQNVDVSVRYWAGARDAAGVDSEGVAAADIAALTQELVERHPLLADVLPRCSLLCDGVRVTAGYELSEGSLIEVLPPFAGG